MTIKAIKNPRYLENGAIDCEVLFEGMDEAVPYTASPDDTAETGRRVWIALQSGKWGEPAPFVVTSEMLEMAKSAKCQEIEAWRSEQETQPFTLEWGGYIWNAGTGALARLFPVTMAAKLENVRDVFIWNDANNQPVQSVGGDYDGELYRAATSGFLYLGQSSDCC